MSGFLAIWSDVAEDQETDYLHWLTREHAAERLGVPGFRAVRVFRADPAPLRRFLILYELIGPEVLASPAYLERLAAPTPWSRRIMPMLRGFVRGGGTWLSTTTTARGGHVLPLRLTASHVALAERALADIALADRVVGAELGEVGRDVTDIPTSEKALREKDASFDGLLLLEALDADALDDAASKLPPSLRVAIPPERYHLVFSLGG